jgi:ATP-binding cassette subfamily B protein
MTQSKWNGVNIPKILSNLAEQFRFRFFPFYHQLERMDCGPACLMMVTTFYGQKISLEYARRICHLSISGSSMKGLVEGASHLGFRALAVQIPFKNKDESKNDFFKVPLPSILFWGKNHYVVVYKISKKHIYLADPSRGKVKVTYDEFNRNWITGPNDTGIALILLPNENFGKSKIFFEPNLTKSNLFDYLFGYAKYYIKYLWVIVAILLCVSLIQYLFPQFTRSIVDIGIQQKQLNFIYWILVIQLILHSSQTLFSFLQNWIILHVSSRINALITSDFFLKLTRLLLSFYDNKYYGGDYSKNQ